MYGHERSLVENFSGRPFVLLGVNTDSKISRVKKAIRENNLNWRSWYDGRRGPIVKDYGIRSYPTIFLVDHTGVIRYKNPGLRHLDLALDKLVAAAEADGMRGGSEPGQKPREFVDITGKHKTIAAYVGFEKGNVVLSKEDGQELKVPWKRLSYPDRQYVAVQRLKQAGLKRVAETSTEFAFEQPHSFKDATGKFSIDATFIALNERKAILWKPDGSEIKIAWKKLSDESKDYINREIKRMK